jgi:LysM repeat protein
MSAKTVYDELNLAISPSGIIDLWAAANNNDYPDLKPINAALQLFGITGSFLLNGCVLSQLNNTVTLTANGTFGQPGAGEDRKYPISATLYYQENLTPEGLFTLTFRFTNSGWSFSYFFNVLPDSRRYIDANQTTEWTESYLKEIILNSVSFSANTQPNESLQLSGFLPWSPVFDPYMGIIPYFPLQISGSITMPATWTDYPLMNLIALAGPGSDISLFNTMPSGGITIQQGPSGLLLTKVGLKLSIIDGLDPAIWGRTAFSTLFMIGHLSLGSLQADLYAPLLASNSLWSLSVQFDPEHSSFVEGISQLTTLFGMPQLPLPDNFPLLNLFRFRELQLYITLPDKVGTGAAINNLALTIVSKEKWTPPIPFVSFSDVGTRWVWAWTTYTNSNGVEISRSMVTGSVFGTINFGDQDSGSDGNDLPELPPSSEQPQTELINRTELTKEDSESNLVRLDVSLGLPSLYISAAMRSGDYIPIGKAFTYFFKNPGPGTIAEMNITTLKFAADPIQQTFTANAAIIFGTPEDIGAYRGWDINLGLVQINLQELNFNIAVSKGGVSGGISGEFMLIQDSDPLDIEQPRMLVSAEYPVQDPTTPEGWIFTGLLYPGTSINLVKLVTRFMDIDATSAPVELYVDALSVSLSTGTQAYGFAGTISMRWYPEIFGTTLKINASASVDIKRLAGQSSASGKLSGSFSVNRIALMASMDVGVTEATYLFKVQFDELWLSATTSWRGEPNKRHQVISLQLGGVTLGDILEYLVNLAAPTVGFSLDPPWDVLKQVDLSRFVLTIDPQDNIVEFVFNANVNLVVAQVDSIGVRYSKVGGQGKVNLILTGSFLDQKYTNEKPLTWDVINDPPPAVPGQGKSLVDLRYVGLGQRVTFNDPTPNTVAESIKLLSKNMTPPPANGNPLPSTMRYAADSQWLIGLDISLMETVALAIIFNDPKLYGLSIGLSGEKAGSLAGLRFEILYKKITDDIGMFRVEFQVPDMFRTIQLGVVSITLGIIVIEIYTNGNFKIDLGFPYNQNFSRSFSLQATIFIGRGGFYFGLLNGDTSTQVPRISNGNFSPVIELGIGISAGVGREIRAGILSGGAFVELQVIFQGVLAWFNPNSSGAASATYFKCQGIAALYGKVYGSVDFAVVKVSVTLEARAQVSIMYESYQPMLIKLSVRVSAQASIKILFIRVHFTFSVGLELEFTLGSAQPTPWILSNNSSSGGSKQLLAFANPGAHSGYRLRTNNHRRMLAMRNTYHATMMSGLRLSSSDSASLSETYILHWQPGAKVFPDSPRKAHLTLLPLFTIAGVPVNWNSDVPTNNNPDYRTAFVLFGDSGIAPDAATAAQCATRSSALSAMTASDEDTSLLAADILTEGLLLYAIGALPRDPAQGNYVTANDLALLLEQLDLPEAMSDGLSIPNLITFFTTNINLWISGDVTPRPDEKSAIVLPMPPFLRWTSSQGGDVDFSDKNEIGPRYEWGISQLLNDYFPVNGESGKKPSDDVPADYESFTSFMFRDFCMMLMQNSIKEMQKHMNDTTVTVTAVSGTVQNLEQVAATLPNTSVHYTIHSGDTIESVAANLGATVEELEFLNPNLVSELQTEPVGTVLTIVLGIAPEVLALDNPDKTFAITQCDLGTLVHQAGENETLQTIAALFQAPDVASLLEFQDNNYPVLSSSSNILLAGSLFDLPQQTFANAPADFVQLRTAAVFFGRYIDLDFTDNTAVPEMADWYIQAINELNQDLLKTLFPEQTIPSVIELPPGHVLSVPNFYGAAYNQPANRNNYTTVAGDTLYRIGYALTFQQDFASSQEFPQWSAFRSKVTSAGANSWNIAAQTGIKVEVGQTIESLVRRLIVSASWSGNPALPATGTWTYDWTSVAAWLGSANVLMPLAAITVPNAKTAVSSSLSFAALSLIYGLTIVDAASRLKTVNNLFADGTVLLVKLLPAQDIDVLVNLILQGDSFASIVNQSSRMLMSGLQLPGLKTEDGHVVPDPANPFPLYDLTGQQFGITVDDSKPTETALALSLFSEQSWIQLFNSITVQPGQTLAELEETYPDLLTFNPGLSPSTFKVGMVLLTSLAETSLNYNYTNEDILDASPAAGLAVPPYPAQNTAPSVLPISGTVPRTYGLEHRIELQTPTPLPIPQVAGQQPVTGNPGMWMLPDALQEKARDDVTTLFEILAAPQGGDAGSNATQIDNSTFGTIIPFKLKRLENSSSQFNLIGVDTDKRYLLLTLSDWLKSQGMGTTKVYQMLSPAPNAANTSGLTVLTADPANAFLIKSNLSTLSVPPSLMLAREGAEAEDSQNVYYASLSSLADFLTLLWEGSVVGGTGYYFSPGQDIPGSAFDQQGNITLQLLVIVGTQQSIAPDGRSLLPFNNCVLIGAGNEGTQLSVYIQSADTTDPSETITQALVPPGNVGFELLTPNPGIPESPSFSDKEILLKTLYSLMSFEVAQTPGSPFCARASGMPVLPNPSDGEKQDPWEQERALRKAKAAGLQEDGDDPLPFWEYKQVMPVSRFILQGTELAAPNVPGLPPASGDPYQGYGTQTKLPSASFVFGFGDVLGNRTGANGAGQGTTIIPVGYTDNLIGVGDWSSTARSFNVNPSPALTDAELSVTISPRPSELIPTPSQPGNVNADTIAQQRDQYASTYYQLIQPGVTGWLVSSLNYIADENYGNKGVRIPDISPLWKFAAGSYAFLSGLSEMQPAKPVGAATLGDIITQYGIRYTELGYANANLLVADLFGTTLPVVPAFYPFVEHQSINQLFTMPPAGYPKPANAKDLLLLPENTSLLLKTGTSLIIPTKSFPTGPNQPTVSLATLASNENTTVFDLAFQNAAQTILETGFEFSVPVDDTTSVTIVVNATNNSLDLMAAAFAAEGVNITAEGLANLHEDDPGMFAVDQTLTTKIYVIKEGDTLDDNSSGQSADTLASLNLDTEDIFDPGALVYFGNFSDVTAGSPPPTLQQFSDRYACPIELLLSSNAGFALPPTTPTTGFVIPGTLSWAADKKINVPYTIRENETLNAIAQGFDFDPADGAAGMQLAATNENMPGTIQPGITLTIPVAGTNYNVDTGNDQPSFATVLKSLQQQAPAATLQDIVNAIGDTPGDLFKSGIFLCPPAKFAQVTTPDTIEGVYGITPAAFALANAATQNLIAAGAVLWNTDHTVSITAITNDTFNSLITRFADKGVSISANEIITSNLTVPLIAANALAFIPPADVIFKVNIGTGGPYPAPIAPLQTMLRIIRPSALIDPSFKTAKGTGPVEMVESDFPAPQKNDVTDSGLTLNDFVKEMKQALPNLRLGTGKVTGAAQDLWQVDFDASGIKDVQLIGGTTVNSKPQPRFFALPPLYQYLVTRTLLIKPLNSDGTLGTAQEISFQSIDTEPWALRFVEEMDRFLSGTYASAVYTDPVIRSQLDVILDAKNTLIPAIAKGLKTVLDVPDPGETDGEASARKALEQQLGVSLSKTYESTVMIQYDSVVDSAWQHSLLEPASLYGNGTIVDNEDGTITSPPPEKTVPGLTMIAAKTDLAEANSFVNFLMTLDNPVFHKDVSGSFQYAISNLEFNITPVNLPRDYKSSDWLTFIPLLAGNEKPAALTGTDPGSVDVPVPLRNFPELPRIVQQQAIQSALDGTQNVSQLSLWDYEFIYSHQHAAQDYVLVNAEFNLHTPPPRAMFEDEPRDLFTELAQYIYVTEQLWNMLNGLVDPATKFSTADIENAVQTYATLVTNISQNWTRRLPPSNFNTDPIDNLVADLSYHFNARVTYNDGNITAYTLTQLDAGELPDVYLQVPSGANTAVPGEYVKLIQQPTIGNVTEYKVPLDKVIPAAAWQTFKLIWKGLNLASVQNARSKMSVERNQNLLDNVNTNGAFLLSTDTVIAPAVVTPLNTFGKRVDITKLGADLTTALNNVFAGLFGANYIGQRITMELSYGFELVPPSETDPGLITYLPIGLYPNQTLSATTASELAAAIQEWQRDNDPEETGGEWVFSLKLYSQLTDQTQMLLNIAHLIYRIAP